MNNYLIKKRAKMDIFPRFSEIQKLKMHILKLFWDTMWCTEKHKNFSEGSWEDMGDMDGYWDFTEGAGTSWGTTRETGP
jgi:hypothetical protein